VDFLAAIERDATATFELCGRDPTRAIPSCAPWSAADLQAHVVDIFRGEVAGFADAAADDIGPADAVRLAVDLLRQRGAPGRDAAHECAVHRWDASDAFAVTYAIEAELACDGVDEFFDAAWPLWLDHFERHAGNGETLRLGRTDGPDHWLVVLADRPVVTDGDGDSDGDGDGDSDSGAADVEVRGSASDLVLWLWGRTPSRAIEGCSSGCGTRRAASSRPASDLRPDRAQAARQRR
jgi:hypothetical protein